MKGKGFAFVWPIFSEDMYRPVSLLARLHYWLAEFPCRLMYSWVMYGYVCASWVGLMANFKLENSPWIH